MTSPVEDPVYSYLWSNNSTEDNIQNVPGGQYCVTVTENTSTCSSIKCFEIPEVGGDPISNVIANITPTCMGESDGAISIEIEGGTSPISWDWGHIHASEGLAENLGAGEYCVTITDECDEYIYCFDVETYPEVNEVNTQAENACHGNDGSITTEITGGTPPFNLVWEGLNNGTSGSEGTEDNIIHNLTADAYSISIVDANGCEIITSVEIEGISLTLVKVSAGCAGVVAEQEGTIVINPTGGTPPFQFMWENEESGNSIEALPGTYEVTITDANQCFLQEEFTIHNSLTVKTLFSDWGYQGESSCLIAEICPGEDPIFIGKFSTIYFPVNESNPCLVGTIICPLPGAQEFDVSDGIWNPIGNIIEDEFQGLCFQEGQCEFNTEIGTITVSANSPTFNCGHCEGGYTTRRFDSFTNDCCGESCCKIEEIRCSSTGIILAQICAGPCNIPIPLRGTEEEYSPKNQETYFIESHPNPVDNELSIHIESFKEKESSLEIIILDIFGRQLFNQPASISNGNNIITINLNSIRTGYGVCFVLVRDSEGIQYAARHLKI